MAKLLRFFTNSHRVSLPVLSIFKRSLRYMHVFIVMVLLQAGVNLIYIRGLVGHVSVQTTEVYARADSKAKREALEKAYADIGLTKPTAQTSWERDPKLKAFLKSLG